MRIFRRVVSAKQQHLTYALRTLQIVPYYQPVLDVVSGGVYGAEVLVRWKRTNGTLSLPDEFVPLAQESGLLIPMTRMLLEQVERDMLALRLRLPRVFHIGLNVCVTVDMLSGMKDAFIHFQRSLPGHVRLTLELLEHDSAETGTELTLLLSQLRATGILIALGDFGTGSNSLDRLACLPADIIKIDKSIVAALGEGNESRCALDEIIQMAQQKNVAIIAEGIETELQHSCLLRKGVALQQGYYWSTPLSFEQFSHYIIQSSETLR
ncbi:EAL domain-containing protein [Citrobacter amalonaticus]|nr:EAL domain-containing protein [Citrobacter amalonaticus]